MNIREVSILSRDAQSLIDALDAELRGEYAPEHMHGVDFDPFHRAGGVFVIAYDDEFPAACGALRPLDDGDVELKRMFVADGYRGRGISRRVLAYLEERAAQLGFARMMLETGDQQLVAIKLYQTSGYQRIDAFGEYAGGPRSVCFCKRLGDVTSS